MNEFATENSEIVEAMMRSSSAMAAANNTLEQTIALNSASVEITRNAETTANAWKTNSTVFMYGNMHRRTYLIAGKV